MIGFHLKKKNNKDENLFSIKMIFQKNRNTRECDHE